MAQSIQEPEHVWLIMMKAMRALTRYAASIPFTGSSEAIAERFQLNPDRGEPTSRYVYR